MKTAITVPRLGWTMEEGTFVAWLKAEGDWVRTGEPLFSLEGDKATQEVEATVDGFLRLDPSGPSPGATVAVGLILGWLEGEGATPAAAAQTGAIGTGSGATTPSARPEETPVVAALTSAPVAPVLRPGGAVEPGRPEEGRQPPRRVAITPRARAAAVRLGMDLSRVEGTGRGGRIRERDVLHSQPMAGVAAGQGAVGQGTLLPLSARRRELVRRLTAVVAEVVPVTLTFRARADALVAWRRQAKRAAVDPTIVPTYNELLVKLAGTALQEHPLLHAQWCAQGIQLLDAIDVGIAVDTELGLVVPVLRAVADRALAELVVEARRLVEAARSGRLRREEMEGGTFTVTNLGGSGVEFFTPILNPPQSAILGVGTLREEPVVEDGRLAVGWLLPLSLTFDHRVLDGAAAARFLTSLQRLMAAPERVR